MNYIDTHIYTIKKLEELAPKFNYSYGYLSGLFQRTTGKTLSEYHKHRKMETGKVLILEKKKSISEIAEMLGYNLYSFSKAFKNTYGVSFADDQPEEVKVKISAYQAKFLRSLLIHASQEEIECNDEFSIFRYFVVPTFEFMQELRKYGSELEVLSPQLLRDEFMDEAGSLYSKYYGEEEQA
jgi:AraC-like DNA-binding protein